MMMMTMVIKMKTMMMTMMAMMTMVIANGDGEDFATGLSATNEREIGAGISCPGQSTVSINMLFFPSL